MNKEEYIELKKQGEGEIINFITRHNLNPNNVVKITEIETKSMDYTGTVSEAVITVKDELFGIDIPETTPIDLEQEKQDLAEEVKKVETEIPVAVYPKKEPDYTAKEPMITEPMKAEDNPYLKIRGAEKKPTIKERMINVLKK